MDGGLPAFPTERGPRTYTRKPTTVLALRYTGGNHAEMCSFGAGQHRLSHGHVVFRGLIVEVGDYWVLWPRGEFSVESPEAMRLLFDLVEESD